MSLEKIPLSPKKDLKSARKNKFQSTKRMIQNTILYSLLGALTLSGVAAENNSNKKNKKDKQSISHIVPEAPLEGVPFSKILESYDQIELLVNSCFPSKISVASKYTKNETQIDTLYHQLKPIRAISHHIRILRDLETRPTPISLGLSLFSPYSLIRVQNLTPDPLLIYKNINQPLDSLYEKQGMPHHFPSEYVLFEKEKSLSDVFIHSGILRANYHNEILEYLQILLHQSPPSPFKKMIVIVSNMGFGRIDDLERLEQIQKNMKEKNVEISFLATDPQNFDRSLFISFSDFYSYIKKQIKEKQETNFFSPPNNLENVIEPLDQAIQFLYKEKNKQKKKNKEIKPLRPSSVDQG